MQTEPPSVELNPLRTALVVFVPHATMNISLFGSSVWAIKLVSSNVSKDRSFQQYLARFGNSADRVTHKKPSNILGKNSLLISLFSYYYLQIKFVSFLRVWPATIPCKRKTIKWATTLDIKKKGKGKKERSSARKKKAASLHPISRKICPCCCKTYFLSFPCWLAENQSKKEELVNNSVFFATLWHSPKC